MDDRVLALCELSNDLLYHKIPRERLSWYVDESLRLGAAAAAGHAGADLERLYAQNGIAIEYKDDGKAAFGMAYRGQITLAKAGCSLEVFRASIRQLAQNSQNGAYPALSYETAKQIHLAHEFFHCLEFWRGRSAAEAAGPVVTLRILGFARRACVNRCSEVAAHAFAKALLGLPVLPNYYDYRYLINTGSMTAAGFDAMLQKYGDLLS